MKTTLLILALAFTAQAGNYSTKKREFRLQYEVVLPELKSGETGELWIPVARSGGAQKVVTNIDNKKLGQLTSDPVFNNNYFYVKFSSADQGKKITLNYRVSRSEKKAYVAKEKDMGPYLRAETLVPQTEKFRNMANEATAGKQTALEQGRALYDYVLKTMKYDKSGTGWGRGDAVYACDVKTGNCTDFHALFIALARTLGIPARFAVGFTIPVKNQAGAIEGYHCWAEFLADGKWIPVDISEAWKEREDAKSVEYYFGHHSSNRFEVSEGRDLVPQIAPKDGPINFLVHPYLEINGKAQKFQGKYSFTPRE